MCQFPYALGRGGSTPIHFKKPRKLSPISKSIVFKKGVAIDNKYFLIEIHKNKNNITIFTNDVETPDSYSLKIPLREAKELMGNTFNYERIVKMLELEEGELVLADPREKNERGLVTAPMQSMSTNKRYEASTGNNFHDSGSNNLQEKLIKSQEFPSKREHKAEKNEKIINEDETKQNFKEEDEDENYSDEEGGEEDLGSYEEKSKGEEYADDDEDEINLKGGDANNSKGKIHNHYSKSMDYKAEDGGGGKEDDKNDHEHEDEEKSKSRNKNKIEDKGKSSENEHDNNTGNDAENDEENYENDEEEEEKEEEKEKEENIEEKEENLDEIISNKDSGNIDVAEHHENQSDIGKDDKEISKSISKNDIHSNIHEDGQKIEKDSKKGSEKSINPYEDEGLFDD